MIRRIVSTALHQPLLIVMLLVLFVAAGLAAFRSLPVEAFPDVSDIQVNVVALYPGHAAEEVEKQVTLPIETVLSGLPHAVRVFSHTQSGLSFVMITYDRPNCVCENIRTAFGRPLSPISSGIVTCFSTSSGA